MEKEKKRKVLGNRKRDYGFPFQQVFEWSSQKDRETLFILTSFLICVVYSSVAALWVTEW